MKSFRLPFKMGRFLWTPDCGEAVLSGREYFGTNLHAKHMDGDGKTVCEYDLGSGLVTNIGVNLMANEVNNMTAATPFATLNSMNYHSTGTGATAAAASDYYLQTPGTHFSGGTNNYYTGAQSIVAPNIYQTVATVTYSGTETVTEWILAMSNAANFSGTATSTTATSLTNTGASFTNTGNKLAGWVIEANSTAINTPTTTVMGQVTVSGTNSGTVLAVGNGWWTLANASGSTPGGTTAYVVYPAIFDHRQFTGIGVNSGDSIQFTYKLTINSGG